MKLIYTLITILLLSINSGELFAQSDTVWNQKPIFTVTCFTDVYYVYDFNQPKTNIRQKFLFNHNRHNEFNINLGLIKFQIEHDKYRANFGLQAGTYVSDNYAAEPIALRNISEANIGISLGGRNRLWLDAGILNSHIGFESAVSIENPTLTRSLSAENSPYYLAGIKLSFKPIKKLELAAFALNGWQRIQRLPGNSLLSFGTQVKYTANKKLKLNWSTFIGTNDPDNIRRMRFFSNLYGIISPSKDLKIIAGIDFGIQQRSKYSKNYNTWLTPVLIAQIKLTPHLNTAFRIEYFQDETGIIIPTTTPNGFQTAGASINFDYNPISNLSCRIEGRWLASRNLIFQKNGLSSSDNFILAFSIAYKFSKQF
jgi:hypothetical protein